MCSNCKNKTTLSDANRDHWNENAQAVWKEDWVIQLGEQETRFLRKYASDMGLKPVEEGKQVKLLDYACGNGLASKALSPYVTSIRGIEISQEMANLFNAEAAASNLGVAPSEARAVIGDLSVRDSESVPQDPALSTPEYHDFDVVIISMALHHVSDPVGMLSALTARMKQGAILIVVEGTNHDDLSKTIGAMVEKAELPKAHSTINHHDQFTETNMRKWLQEVGCRDDKFMYAVHDEISHIPEHVVKMKGGMDRRLAIAASVKA